VITLLLIELKTLNTPASDEYYGYATPLESISSSLYSISLKLH
jgi:hypothetical protein